MPLDPYNESSKKHTKSQDACGTFHAPFLIKLDLGVIQNDLGAVPKIVARDRLFQLRVGPEKQDHNAEKGGSLGCELDDAKSKHSNVL